MGRARTFLGLGPEIFSSRSALRLEPRATAALWEGGIFSLASCSTSVDNCRPEASWLGRSCAETSLFVALFSGTKSPTKNESAADEGAGRISDDIELEVGRLVEA